MTKNLIIDISHHQPNNKIDWKSAAKEVALFIIRTQDGTSVIDREYKKHVASCKQHNIPFGHYMYTRFKNKDDAIREAKDFLNRCDDNAKFLVVDVEVQTTKTKAEMAPATQAFIDYLKANDSRPIGLYTGHHFYKPYGMDKVKADFLWIPRYGKNDGTPSTKPDYACDIWQYTEKGRVRWYGGFLDLNQLNGSKSLEWFLGTEEKPPAPIVENKVETLEWDGMVLKKGQIGRITILEDINLWSDDGNGKIKMVRVLKPGERFRVYGYRDKYEGQYDVGDGHWVTKITTHIRYETPSKALLAKAAELYK